LSVFKNYQHMVRLRWAFFRSDAYQNSFAARTLMLTGVSRDLQSDEALNGLLSTIGMPYPTTEVHIGRVMGSLPEIIELHDDTVRKLERVLASYLKDPNKIPDNRPMIRVHQTMGMFGGQKVDAIDHYTAQINKLEASIENWRDRIAERKPESYGFASMGAVPYAHAAAKSLKGKKPRGVKIELAPEPRDILWKNLVMSTSARISSNFFGFLYLSIVVFINAVPLLAVALIAQMSSFLPTLAFLRAWHSASAWSFAAVAGLVPPAISGIMGYFLPIIMRKIAKYRGERTRTQLDKVVTAQYFAFNIVSQFVLFTLIGILITSIATIVSEITDHKSAGAIFHTLRDQTVVVKKQYLNMSNYWLTWIPLRFYLAIFDLAQVLKLLLVWFQKGFLGRTPRDVREYTKPPHFEYSIYYANLLFLFAVGLLYACLAPLVIIFTAAAFWISLGVYKYQMMYVSVTKVESGGQLWRVIVNRLLASIIFMQLILIFVVALDNVSTTSRIIKAVASVPPIAIVIGFKIYCTARFDRQFDWYIPEAPEMATIKIHGGDVRHNRLQRRFGHPSLHQKLFTPMVHAKVKHLLPLVYRGRMEQSSTMDVDGRKVEAEEVTGGLRIAAVEEYQLEYDPKMDSDNQSVVSTSTFASRNARLGPNRMGTADTNQFNMMHKQYLAGGNQMSRDGSMGVEDYEMGALGNTSQENLLEKAMHGRKASNMTYASSRGGAMEYSVSQTTPGLEYPPGQSPMDLSTIPLTHHQNSSQVSFGSTGGYFAAPVASQNYPVASPYYNVATQYSNAGPPPPQSANYTSGPINSSPSGIGQPQRLQGRPSPGSVLPPSFNEPPLGPNVAANMYNTPPQHQYQQPPYQQRGPRYQQQQPRRPPGGPDYQGYQ
jgi:hypothetical protein